MIVGTPPEDIDAAEHQDGGQVAGDHLFISYATEDSALAEWLALRLTAEDYKVWIDCFKLLGGERFPQDIDAAIKTKTFRLLQLVSRSSIDKPNPTKERTLALSIGRARGIDFLIPLNVDGIPAEELNWMLSDLTYIPFCPGWARGFTQLLKKLRKVGAPRFEGDGRAIAASQFLPDDVLTSEPESLYSNLIPVAQSPEVIHRFRWSRHLSALERQALEDAWPHYATERQDGLHRRMYSYAFEAPPTGLVENFLTYEEGGAVWSQTEEMDGISCWQLARPLLTKTLVRAMRQRGLEVTTGRWQDFYFPGGLLEKDKIWYRSYTGGKVPLQVAGERTFRGKETFRYNLGFHMDFVRLSGGELAAKFRTRLKISDAKGDPFDSHITANARRKSITRTWYNDDLLKRELAILSFLAHGGDAIDLGSGLCLQAMPKVETAPFGIDEGALPKGRQPFRHRQDDDDDLDEEPWEEYEVESSAEDDE